jgi:hypothetical protein
LIRKRKPYAICLATVCNHWPYGKNINKQKYTSPRLPFSQASWGRLDMKPNKNIRKPTRGEQKISKQGTSKLRFSPQKKE